MDKIPLPTDHIFKFYALFGLLLLIFSTGATLLQTRTTNTRVYDLALELEATRQAAPQGKPSLKAQMLERLLDVEKSDKRFFGTALGVLSAIGLFLMLYGFRKWHKEVQPLQDEMLRLQVEKLRREVPALPPVSSPSSDTPTTFGAL